MTTYQNKTFQIEWDYVFPSCNEGLAGCVVAIHWVNVTDHVYYLL